MDNFAYLFLLEDCYFCCKFLSHISKLIMYEYLIAMIFQIFFSSDNRQLRNYLLSA